MLRNLFIFLLLLIVVLVLWIFLPLEDAGFSLDENDNFLSVSIDIQTENEQVFEEISNFKFQEEYVIESENTRKLIKSAGKFLLPLGVSIVAEPKDNDAEDFNYVAVIKSERLRRLSQIALTFYKLTPDFRQDFTSRKEGGWQVLVARSKDADLQCLAYYRDTIIFSSDAGLFQDIFKATQANIKAVKDDTQIQESQRALLKIVVNNEHGLFEYYVNALKNEASYNVFRSAEQLRKINISLLPAKVSSEHQGQMVFEFTAGVDLVSSKKDVRFFMQLIRRIMDANSYMFKYTLEENINLIKVEYNLQKIRREN
jgi:hypothetical protein